MNKKLKFSIVERPSEKLGVVYDVVNSKNVVVKTFVNEDFAVRFINKTILEAEFEKATKRKPKGLASDLKKVFGEDLINEIVEL